MSSYVSEELRSRFETLSIDLKNRILERNVSLNTVQDLIQALEDYVSDREERGEEHVS